MGDGGCGSVGQACLSVCLCGWVVWGVACGIMGFWTLEERVRVRRSVFGLTIENTDNGAGVMV